MPVERDQSRIHRTGDSGARLKDQGQSPGSNLYVPIFFAIEFPRHRFKIGVPHIDFYSSRKRTYNKLVTDQVTPKNFFDIWGHDY